ncbi:hypothetical protein CC86DRAFT_466718 [Ophiobolus disseminans]|uniref:Uncharacterized protein n=1 Tax=Ophiobolus disseminans TaxID=1469910 RepID=A0A6A7A1G4_9PLEO|nr:hypothetical protein CC86DRAFT_466718 [Ophiobolus disseminans]
MEQFYAEAEFSAGNGEDAMPLESKLSQSSLLTITKARTLTFFSVKAFYRFDPKTYLEFLDTPTTWFEPVGFLLSDLQRDLFFQLGACNNLHHLKFVILWEPISNTKSQDLENESVEDIDAVTSLFGYVRTVEFFVALRKPWAPLKRPCGRAAMEFSEEIMCIMGSSERVPRVEFRFLQGDSMVCPWGSYWKKKYLESTHDSPLNSDFSHTFVFDIPDSS